MPAAQDETYGLRRKILGLRPLPPRNFRNHTTKKSCAFNVTGVLHGKLWRAPVERGLRRQKIVPQASACCAKSPNFSDFRGVDPAQQQVRLNVTGV